MKDLPGDDYVNEDDVICDYSVASSTPTKSSKEGDSVDAALNQEENKENTMPLVDADSVEAHTIKMYRQSISDETFAEKVAAGLAVELPPTLVGPNPESKEEKDLRLKDLRERVERKAHDRQSKQEAKGLESVVDPRGTPVMSFGEPYFQPKSGCCHVGMCSSSVRGSPGWLYTASRSSCHVAHVWFSSPPYRCAT